MDRSTVPGPAEDILEAGNHANSSQNPETLKHQSFPYTSHSMGKNMGVRRNYKRAANRGKKGSQVLASRNYPLRSSDGTVRILRSRSVEEKSPNDSVHTLIEKAAKEPHSDPVNTLVKRAAKKTKKGKPTKKSSDNEFSKIRQRVRYILNRMNYEQSLLEAYASEGWKRQSLEKIRPEKELERAKAEIVRCKLRIREAFQSLDDLLSVGKLQESLFDSEGEISCEDIVCATCSTQDVTSNNDIILCDGVCDRGFHQKCLNPPLLTKDIPVGDEGWLCPACDCKIDCIDIINELQGTDLSINDSWEKVFPEAVAVARGPMQNDAFDLPSDDSEDDDFDPDAAEEHVAGHVEVSSEVGGDEDSDSDDSDFITSSDNSEHVKEKEKVDDLGLPSEDSEDDDYDPAGPDSDKDIEEKQDESDFTSDSDDFCAEIAKSCGQDEVSSGPKVGDCSDDMVGATVQPNTAMPHLTSKDLEIDQDLILPSGRRRQVQRLDYKKLYDDAYGEAPSDSSDSEDWSGKSTFKEDDEEKNEVESFARSREARVVQQNSECSPRSARQSLHPDGFHGLVNGQHAGELTSDGSNSKTKKRQFGPIINERLNKQFTTDQYPSRAVKESLAKELGLTYRQVNKWFESTRSAARVAATKNGTHLENHGNKRKRGSVVTRAEVAEPKEMMFEKPNACKNEGIKQDVSSGNSEPLENIEKVTDLGLPSDDSEDDAYDPTSPDSDKDIEEKQSVSDESDSDDSNFITSSDNSEHVKEKEKVDDLGLPSEDSEDDDYDPAGPDSDKDIKEKQGESDFTSDSDDRDKYVVLPASGRRQVQSLDSKELYDEANQEAPFDSKHGEDLPEKSTPEKHNGKPSEAGPFVPKNSRSTETVSQSNEFTPQSAPQNLHDSVNGEHAEELLTPNGSNSAVQKGKFGPIVNQRLLELFETDRYPSRAVKESLAQELGLTFRQVSKWFESKRRNRRVPSNRSGTQVDNHSTEENGSSVAAHVEVTDSMETMVEKPNVSNSDAANEDMPSGVLNKGMKQDSPLKRDIGGALKTNVSPPNSSHRCTPTKGESREKHGENASSSSVGKRKDGDAEDVVLALEAVDERTKNSVLRELKKRKIG
uniref:Uncharacterized protein n=1 Tax=Avena sativa TaxID=4498 RepID=A0ACD5T8G4_AVESA